jgi:hypothetical protein
MTSGLQKLRPRFFPFFCLAAIAEIIVPVGSDLAFLCTTCTYCLLLPCCCHCSIKHSGARIPTGPDPFPASGTHFNSPRQRFHAGRRLLQPLPFLPLAFWHRSTLHRKDYRLGLQTSPERAPENIILLDLVPPRNLAIRNNSRLETSIL